jgi:hypothetical protein
MLVTLCCIAVSSIAHAQSNLFVLTTDFATGSTAFWDPQETEAKVNLLNVHSDAVGKYYDGKVYIINRLGQDNIIVLDENDLSTPLLQFSVGNGANPHDIEIVADDKAYVSLYATAELLIVNPQNGDELGRIDLSTFADADGLPEVSQIVRAGPRLYLSCQRLDRDNGWIPVEPSYLIVVDIASDSVVDVDPTTDGVQGIALQAPNPNGMIAAGDKLIVSVVSTFGDLAGGIEIVDPSNNLSLGLAINEESLGGDITGLVMATEDEGFALVTDANWANLVRPVNLATGSVAPPLVGLSGGYIASFAVDGDRLIVGDRGSFDDPNAAGLKIYDTATAAPITGPISTGLPPSNIVVLGQKMIPTAVAEENAEALPAQFGLDNPYPNPFNASVLISFQVDSDYAQVELTVFDMLGRNVRTLTSGALGRGQHVQQWDGRDNTGHIAGNGSYLVQLRVGDQQTATKITLLK